MEEVLWKPELWKSLAVKRITFKGGDTTPPVKSFYDYQDPAETYEVRGILPHAKVVFRDQD